MVWRGWKYYSVLTKYYCFYTDEDVKNQYQLKVNCSVKCKWGDEESPTEKQFLQKQLQYFQKCHKF